MRKVNVTSTQVLYMFSLCILISTSLSFTTLGYYYFGILHVQTEFCQKAFQPPLTVQGLPFVLLLLLCSLQKWLAADYKLYNHFEQKFKHAVERYVVLISPEKLNKT